MIERGKAEDIGLRKTGQGRRTWGGGGSFYLKRHARALSEEPLHILAFPARAISNQIRDREECIDQSQGRKRERDNQTGTGQVPTPTAEEKWPDIQIEGPDVHSSAVCSAENVLVSGNKRVSQVNECLEAGERFNLWPSTIVQLWVVVVVFEQPSSPVLEDDEVQDEEEELKNIVVTPVLTSSEF